MPIEVLERLAALPNSRIIRGNTDRYVYSGDRPPPSMEDARANPKLMNGIVECAGTFAWTQGVLAVGGWNAWLEALPVETEVVLPPVHSVTRPARPSVSPCRLPGATTKQKRETT